MREGQGRKVAVVAGTLNRKHVIKSEIRDPKSEARISAALRGQRSVVASAALPCASLIRKTFPRTISARALRISSFPGALLNRLVPLLLLSISVCLGQRQNDPRPAPMDPVEAVEQAQALVRDMLAQRPDQNTTNTGRVKIRDAAGKEREIPVRFEITSTSTGWESVYETLPSAGSSGGTRLTVIHSGEQPNRYELLHPAAPGATNAVPQQLGQDQIMAPFVGCDFWVADLGLEFLHWPKQRLLRKEMRHSKFCYVLESINPQPVPGGYSRVESWLIFDPPHGIVHADAYDARGYRLKQFDPKSLEKVDGEYQLESMEILNRKAHTRTEIKFDFDHK
jgi:hypothetical protein